MQEEIAKLLSQVLAGPLGVDTSAVGDLEPAIEEPKNKEHGDLAFPCFRLAKIMRKPPHAIAQDLLPHLIEAVAESSDIESVSAMGPYLNFKTNTSALAVAVIPQILDGSFLNRRSDRGQRVMIEYSQPNTHKAFHVGHTRNVALGDALWRIFDWAGYETVPTNYIGDEGAHIAKCLWYYQHHFDGEIPDVNLGEFLGELYTNATIMLDFKRLTDCPMPNVVSAEVLEIHAIEGSDKLKRVLVDDGDAKHQVVCGGIDYKVGDIVAYARDGARVAGRAISAVEKAGVLSTGMILSELELGTSDDKERIHTFAAGVLLGKQMTELFRKADAPIPNDVPVLDVMAERTEGVAETLRKLEAREPELFALWEKTKGWSMDEFHRIYDWLGARFDHYFFESDVGDEGKRIVLDYLDKGVLVKSEGAVGADLSDAKLPFFLLLKSDGSGLYSTKDIALAKEKFEKFGVDWSIYVVDHSQSLHFQQVFKTLELMGYEKARDCYHLAYGLVVLPDGKMSSREGNIILFSELREKLDEKIRHEFLDKYVGDWPEEEITEAARRISVGTIRYGMCNQDNLKNIVFDLDEWTARSGNTGPYMMYAYARTRSILRDAGDWDLASADWALLKDEHEQILLADMAKFPEAVERACREYRPQWLCIYLYGLAKNFSRFYDHCPVLKAESDALRTTRLALVDAAGQELCKGLELLGIQTLERM